MSGPYRAVRAVIVEVDPEFFHIELEALETHLSEIGLPPIAVFDPESSSYCVLCGSTYPLAWPHACEIASRVSR